MKVLFLMFTFPDMDKSFNMFTTIVEEFVAHGHEVVVLAPGDKASRIQEEKGIPILRVKTLPLKNVPNYLKGIANVLLPYQFQKALGKFYPNNSFDLIISPTPPITLVGLVTRLKLKFGSNFYLILRDIFPQNAVDLGFMKKDGLIHNYFRSREVKLYREADFIGCMSQGNIDYILRENPQLSPNKLHILRNFQKPYKKKLLSDNVIINKFNLEDKFVVVFGGNMGKPQQMENVLELAASCMGNLEIVFLLLGEGLQAQRIAEIIKEKKLSNVKIQDTVKKDEYQDLLSVCHVGLISLHKDFTIPNIPSKALDYFNVGLPVLASIDRHTDFGQILETDRLGLWSLAGDHDGFKKNLELLFHSASLRKEFSENVRSYFKKYLMPEKAYRTIIRATNESYTESNR